MFYQTTSIPGFRTPHSALRTFFWLLVLTLTAHSALAQVAGCPTNKTVECGSTWTFDDPTGAGPCTATNAPTIIITGTITNAQACGFTATRTWQVSDVCGNNATCSQTVTNVDTTPPVPICASNKTVQCGSAWTFDPPTATDVCCGTNITITILSTTTNGNICPPTITRTWEIMDCCRNHVLCSQTVTAIDTTPPVITCATNKTVPQGTIISFDPPTAIDSCCGLKVSITVLNTVTNTVACGEDITRTWVATDCCGNTSTCSQTITVLSPQSPPQISSLYAPCGGSKITIGFSRPLSAASAQNTANYVINCGGTTIPVNQAVLAGPQIVCLFLAQPVGTGCSISVANIQDPCGNTMPNFNQSFVCTNEPCPGGSAGIEYWLTFPGNHAPDPADQPQPQLFITGVAGTVGNVAIPGLALPFSFNFTIPVAGDVTVPLPVDADLGSANDLVQTNGIHVIASQPIAVYGLNYVRFSSDGYLGLSTAALGKAYRVLAYKNMFPDVPELAGSQFAVVGTVNGTTVTIVPPSDVGVHPGSIPFNFTLMQGETYQLRQTNTTSDDLSGALVFADQPIAVFGGHACANIPDTNTFFCDHLVEQLPPTQLWGTNFITVTLTNRLRSDAFRFLALLTNTIVRTNGVALPPLNQGEFAEVQLAANSQITATKPILVAQYANSSDFDVVQFSDPFMTLIPPTSLYGTSYIIHSPPNFPFNFVNITVPAGGVSQISLDGGLIPANRFSAIGASGYSGARINVAGGRHTLSSSGSAFGVIVYGWSQYDAYGYPAGLCLPSPGNPTVSFTCPPANIALQVGANCTAVVPNLSSQIGNAAAALLITQFPLSGTVVGPGVYNITNTILDQFGSQHVCVTTLTVSQNGPSGLLCPNNIVTNCASSLGRTVTFQPTVCDPSFTISCNPPSGSLFPPGVTAVTCTAVGPGAVDQCSFSVTVNCLILTISPTPPTGLNQTLLWPGTGTLYTATNVVGPFVPLPGVTSPYTNRIRGAQGFFRIGP